MYTGYVLFLAGLAAVGLAGGDLALETGGEEFLVAPDLGPGALREALDAGQHRGAFSSRHR
jgi:hypothetical protein